jgi:TfoX/Sxy family transcriptional regulator of competence genes
MLVGVGTEDSFEALATRQLAVAGVTRRLMFGRDALLADGHVFAFRDGDRVAVKHPSAGELVASGRGVAPVMGSRAMRQWVAVEPGASPELDEWVEAARRSAVH